MNGHKSGNCNIIVAWVIVISSSLLPKVILQEVFHQNVTPLIQSTISAGIALSGLLLTYLWPSIRKLRIFIFLLFVLVIIEYLVFNHLDQLDFYRSWLNNPSFNIYMLAEQSLRLVVTIAIIATLYTIKKKRSAFFLVKGDIKAKVEAVRWLGVGQDENWKKFGLILSLCISLGTLAFLILAGRPPLDIVVKALPFLPAVLLAAGLNAFNEEMTYKSSFLSVLEDSVGKKQALLLMAAFFGLGHYYGVPYGIVGVIMAGFLGWILGKSMLETRGMFWAWFIHFWQDVLIFSFLAIGSITAGGG
jgi:hypothetical protein